MRTLLLCISAVLLGCQSATVQENPNKIKVASNAYQISICNFRPYNYPDCPADVRSNIKREKLRRVAELLEIERYFKSNSQHYEESFYTSYPAVNAIGEDVPYFKFYLVQTFPPKDGNPAIFVFANSSYNYRLLWSSDNESLIRKSQIGDPLYGFMDCAVLMSTEGMSLENGASLYNLIDVSCE
ncbi:hypothetical protein AB4320_05545 [Vibrio splendidus]